MARILKTLNGNFDFSTPTPLCVSMHPTSRPRFICNIQGAIGVWKQGDTFGSGNGTNSIFALFRVRPSESRPSHGL